MAAVEPQGGFAAEEVHLLAVSVCASCDAITGEYAAVKDSEITAVRMKCLELYVLASIFSPIEMFWWSER